jgi:hypothetical protein
MESLGWEREVRRVSRQLTSIITRLETPALHLKQYSTVQYLIVSRTLCCLLD